MLKTLTTQPVTSETKRCKADRKKTIISSQK